MQLSSRLTFEAVPDLLTLQYMLCAHLDFILPAYICGMHASHGHLVCHHRLFQACGYTGLSPLVTQASVI